MVGREVDITEIAESRVVVMCGVTDTHVTYSIHPLSRPLLERDGKLRTTHISVEPYGKVSADKAKESIEKQRNTWDQTVSILTSRVGVDQKDPVDYILYCPATGDVFEPVRGSMVPCVIESPFAAGNGHSVEDNRSYLRRAIRWCVESGYTPYASHEMLTHAFDDSNADERALGIRAGLDMSKALRNLAGAKIFFFTGHGWSKGMLAAKAEYERDQIPFTTLCLDP